MLLKPLDKTGYTKDVEWCGPSAISILAGRPLAETTSALSKLREESYSELDGVWPQEVVLILSQYGYKSKPLPLMERYPDTPYGPTLKRFLNERQGMELVMPLLIEVQNHLLVAHMGFAADNWTKKPVPIKSFPKLGRLVKSVYMVSKTF